MIKYLGSKRLLVPAIAGVVERLGVSSAVDLFTGTTRVAWELKRRGLHVLANDTAAYAYQFARCYIEADVTALDLPKLRDWLDMLAATPLLRGYVTRTFAEEARFFSVPNAMRIDAIRAAIDRLPALPLERAILLTSLIEAADRVDSTVGVQMAYLKAYAPRAHNPLALRLPELLPGVGAATMRDAVELAAAPELAGYHLTYLDPPYNAHSYLGNYHVWETLARGDEPEAYGIARKRADVRERKSAFNRRGEALPALNAIIAALPTPWILVSFSDEGFLSAQDVISALAAVRPAVAVASLSHPRYVGSKIGIYNPSGAKVGTPGKARNRERLFLAGPDLAAADAALAGIRATAVGEGEGETAS